MIEKPRYKSICLKAKMKDEGKFVNVKKKIGTKMITKTKVKLFKKNETYEVEVPIYETETKWEVTGKSKTEIDLENLNNQIFDTCNNLDQEEYQVLQITPITSGKFKSEVKKDYKFDTRNLSTGGYGYGYGWGYGYGYGYSITDKIIILAKLKE